MKIDNHDFSGLPGSRGIVSEHSLLLMIASPRLRRLGLNFSDLKVKKPYEHSLYSLLEETRGKNAYSYYNSLIRRIVSFAHCLERESSKQS